MTVHAAVSICRKISCFIDSIDPGIIDNTETNISDCIVDSVIFRYILKILDQNEKTLGQ